MTVRQQRGLDLRALVDRLYPPVGEDRSADVLRSDRLRHYLTRGWREGQDPNRWFAGRFYAASSGVADICPLIHFVRKGAAAGLPPHPWVDLGWYAKRYLGRSRPSALTLLHFLEVGAAAGHVPHPALDTSEVADVLSDTAPDSRESAIVDIIAARVAERTAIRQSAALVDRDWYRATYPDVARAGVDPADHYLHTGWREQRDPGPWFSTSFYLSRQPAAAAEDICPLVHYCERGAATGALPHPRFDAQWYAGRYLPGGLPRDAFAHFLGEGMAAGCVPHPALDRPDVAARVRDAPAPHRSRVLADLLDSADLDADDPVAMLVDPVWYRAQAPALGSVTDCVRHYREQGWKEGYDPNPWFSGAYYLASVPDIAGRCCPLEHFIATGAAAGHDPCQEFDLAWYARRHLGWETPRAEAFRHFIQVGLAGGLAPNRNLDGPGAAAHLAAFPPANRPAVVRELAVLVSRLRAAGSATDPDRERLWGWLGRLVAPGARAVLLVGPAPEASGLALARAAAMALPPGEVAIAAAMHPDGVLAIAPDDRLPPLQLSPSGEPLAMRALVRATRCSRAALLGSWSGAAALARALRNAGLAVAHPEY